MNHLLCNTRLRQTCFVQLPNILPSFVQTVGKSAERTFNLQAKEFYMLNFQYEQLIPNVFKPEATAMSNRMPKSCKKETRALPQHNRNLHSLLTVDEDRIFGHTLSLNQGNVSSKTATSTKRFLSGKQMTVQGTRLASKAISMNISRHDKDIEKQLNVQIKPEHEFLEDDNTQERLLISNKFVNLTRKSHLFVFQTAISLNWNVSRNELRNLCLLPATKTGYVDLGCYLHVHYNITTFATVACPTVRKWSALYV